MQKDLKKFLQEVRIQPLKRQEEMISEFKSSKENIDSLLKFAKQTVASIAAFTKDNIDYELCDDLMSALFVLGVLEEEKAFPLMLKLALIDDEKFEEDSRWIDLLDNSSVLMAKYSLHNWEQLKQLIENPRISALCRSEGLEAILHLIAINMLSRSTAMNYFKELLLEVFDNPDLEFAGYLIWDCCRLHPLDVIEEIKELYGWDLVDSGIIAIENVITDLNKTQEEVMSELKRRMLKKEELLDILRYFFDEKSFSDEKIKLDPSYLKKLENLEKKLSNPLPPWPSYTTLWGKPEQRNRNELCFCGSGKKYKKCCIGKEDKNEEEFQNLKSFSYKVAFEPVEGLLHKDLSSLEFEQVMQIYNRHHEISDDAIPTLLYLKKKYPHVPELYNHLFNAYVLLEKFKEARDILNETIKRFPKYLFGLLEYGNYLIKRGEYEKIPELFDNKYDVKALYPERDVFHFSEVLGFCYIMGRYFTGIKDFARADLYLHIISTIHPESKQKYALEEFISDQYKQHYFALETNL